MRIAKPRARFFSRWARAIATALTLSTAGGCAGPIVDAWSRRQTDKRLEAQLADDSFPTAAQIGLISSEVKSK